MTDTSDYMHDQINLQHQYMAKESHLSEHTPICHTFRVTVKFQHQTDQWWLNDNLEHQLIKL